MSFTDKPSSASPAGPVPLRDDEIEELYHEFDHDKDGKVSFEDVEATLRSVLEELAPRPHRHHLTHPDRSTSRVKRWTRSLMPWDAGVAESQGRDSDLHDFLQRLLPGCEDLMTRAEFFNQVRSWNIPSQTQTSGRAKTQQAKANDRKLPLGRRFAAWWSVKGPEVAFLAVVVALILAFSLWQGLKYALNKRARAAFGYGVVVAKFAAGAMYPTFFFMILSMSRWFATFCRKSYLVSRVINWDLSRTFHIRMSCLALFLSLLHTLSHVFGTLISATQKKNQKSVQKYFGRAYVKRTYIDFV